MGGPSRRAWGLCSLQGFSSVVSKWLSSWTICTWGFLVVFQGKQDTSSWKALFSPPVIWGEISFILNQTQIHTSGLECEIHLDFKNKLWDFKDVLSLGATLYSCLDLPLSIIIHYSKLSYRKSLKRPTQEIRVCLQHSLSSSVSFQNWTVQASYCSDSHLRISL